jgi:hypothetical protein
LNNQVTPTKQEKQSRDSRRPRNDRPRNDRPTASEAPTPAAEAVKEGE